MRNYKIAVAGTGYVGLSLGVLLSQHHQVVAVDIVQAKVDMINNKKSPMYHRRYDYFVLILPFASIFMENTRKSKCWNICVCVLTIGVLTMGNFMDLESSVGKTVNSIMTSYIPYTSLCNVFNAILIALLYLVLFMSHRVFLENKRSIKKENEGEI